MTEEQVKYGEKRSLAEEKAKRIKLLEETRARRAELTAELVLLQDQLARARAAQLVGSPGENIPALQKDVGRVERGLADLEGVDRVIETEIEEIGRQEHGERVREAEGQRAEAIKALEDALAAYREFRLELLSAAQILDEARSGAYNAHARWEQLTGAPQPSPELYNWDKQQKLALDTLRSAAVDEPDRLEEFDRIVARNKQRQQVS